MGYIGNNMSDLSWTTEVRAIKELIPASYNPRQLTAKQAKELRKSLQKFNVVEPPAINQDGTIISGHQRLALLADIGIADVEVRVPNRQLTPDEEKELNLRMNQNRGEFDFDALANNFDIDFLKEVGFDDKELDKLMGKQDHSEDDEFDAEKEAEAIKTPVVQVGDIWQLGSHRLMCGDSTAKQDVERLMDGKKADMVFTDPPYALFGNSTGVAGVADDKMIRSFFRDIAHRLKESIKKGKHLYSCCDWHSWNVVFDLYSLNGWTPKQMIVWDKLRGGLGTNYRSRHELIFFAIEGSNDQSSSTGANVNKRRITDENLWQSKRERDGEHNAQKPLEIMSRAIKNSSDLDDIVLDLFLGSGSTLIACENLKRRCYGMEIDPKYCDVIIKRWEEKTGKKASKITV